MKKNVEVAIIGAGSAGLAAMGQVAKVTDDFVLINGGELGTTCARVGCMPSKAAIQVAEDYARRHFFSRVGIEGKETLQLDAEEAMEHVRDMRDIFVDRVLAGTTDNMGEEFVEGYARFVDKNILEVNGEQLTAKKIVIATGSHPIIAKQWLEFKDKILTTDDFFEQESLPASVAVIGLGVIGLEIGQTLQRMGVAVTGFDQLETIAGLQDPLVNQVALDIIGKEFPMHLGHAVEIEATDDLLRVSANGVSIEVEKLFVSIGRAPNLAGLGLENLGVELNEKGIPRYNSHTMQIEDLPIFIAGDVTTERAILHEANDEGRIAGYNAVHSMQSFARRTPLMITFCDPNIALVGSAWEALDQSTLAIGEIRFGPVGRAVVMGKNKGILRVYADKQTGQILGAAMCAPKGEHLAHLLALAVQQKLTVVQMLQMPFYHPAIEEGLQAALYDCLDKTELAVDQMPELKRL